MHRQQKLGENSSRHVMHIIAWHANSHNVFGSV